MNNHRIRLALGSALVAVALTVLTLKLLGFLAPAAQSGTLQLTASPETAQRPASRYHIHCQNKLATLLDNRQVEPVRHLLDPHGQSISCNNGP